MHRGVQEKDVGEGVFKQEDLHSQRPGVGWPSCGAVGVSGARLPRGFGAHWRMPGLGTWPEMGRS